MNSMFDVLQIASGIKPVDLGAAGAASDYVSLKNYGKALFVFHKALGTSGEDTTLTVSQATKVDGTGKKALNFAKYAYKVGTDLETVGQFTHVTDHATNTLVVAGVTEALIAIEIDVESLDVNNGFDCVVVEASDPGTSGALASGLWLFGFPRYNQSPQLSAIAD